LHAEREPLAVLAHIRRTIGEYNFAGQYQQGFHSFENGHLLSWANWPNPEDRPNWEQRGKWAAQFGEARADWMVGRLRNLCLYPNVYLMDQMSSQIRHYRPIAVDKTK
jgi:benzoate/toluate 1,2-dioxygenase subunit alpha